MSINGYNSIYFSELSPVSPFYSARNALNADKESAPFTPLIPTDRNQLDWTSFEANLMPLPEHETENTQSASIQNDPPIPSFAPIANQNRIPSTSYEYPLVQYSSIERRNKPYSAWSNEEELRVFSLLKLSNKISLKDKYKDVSNSLKKEAGNKTRSKRHIQKLYTRLGCNLNLITTDEAKFVELGHKFDYNWENVKIHCDDLKSYTVEDCFKMYNKLLMRIRNAKNKRFSPTTNESLRVLSLILLSEKTTLQKTYKEVLTILNGEEGSKRRPKSQSSVAKIYEELGRDLINIDEARFAESGHRFHLDWEIAKNHCPELQSYTVEECIEKYEGLLERIEKAKKAKNFRSHIWTNYKMEIPTPPPAQIPFQVAIPTARTNTHINSSFQESEHFSEIGWAEPHLEPGHFNLMPATSSHPSLEIIPGGIEVEKIPFTVSCTDSREEFLKLPTSHSNLDSNAQTTFRTKTMVFSNSGSSASKRKNMSWTTEKVLRLFSLLRLSPETLLRHKFANTFETLKKEASKDYPVKSAFSMQKVLYNYGNINLITDEEAKFVELGHQCNYNWVEAKKVYQTLDYTVEECRKKYKELLTRIKRAKKECQKEKKRKEADLLKKMHPNPQNPRQSEQDPLSQQSRNLRFIPSGRSPFSPEKISTLSSHPEPHTLNLPLSSDSTICDDLGINYEGSHERNSFSPHSKSGRNSYITPDLNEPAAQNRKEGYQSKKTHAFLDIGLEPSVTVPSDPIHCYNETSSSPQSILNLLQCLETSASSSTQGESLEFDGSTTPQFIQKIVPTTKGAPQQFLPHVLATQTPSKLQEREQAIPIIKFKLSSCPTGRSQTPAATTTDYPSGNFQDLPNESSSPSPVFSAPQTIDQLPRNTLIEPPPYAPAQKQNHERYYYVYPEPMSKPKPLAANGKPICPSSIQVTEGSQTSHPRFADESFLQKEIERERRKALDARPMDQQQRMEGMDSSLSLISEPRKDVTDELSKLFFPRSRLFSPSNPHFSRGLQTEILRSGPQENLPHQQSLTTSIPRKLLPNQASVGYRVENIIGKKRPFQELNQSGRSTDE